MIGGAERSLGADAADALGRLTLAEIARFWRSPEDFSPTAEQLFRSLPDSVQRTTAAGFELRARKPA